MTPRQVMFYTHGMVIQVRPTIPCAPVVLEILAEAVINEQAPGALLAKLAGQGACRLLPKGLTKTSSEVRGAYHGTFTPDVRRDFRPVVRIENEVEERIHAISFVLRRHPREAWYLVLAVGWSVYKGDLPAPDIEKLVSERFPDAPLKAHDPRPRVLGAEEMAARFGE